MKKLSMHKRRWTSALAVSAALFGCGDDEAGVGTGSLTVLLETEEVIVDGLSPGDEGENIQDGWAVDFEKYIVTIGSIDAHLATDDSIEAESGDVYVVDLTEAPGSGFDLWELDELAEGRWNFGYATPGAADGSTRHPSVSESDYEEMVDNDWTYLIDGELTQDDGQSCPPAALADPGDKDANGNTSGDNDCYDAPKVRFMFGASAETGFTDCRIDGSRGFAVTEGGTQTVSASIHGDHLFFNGFPEGSEGGVRRLAQWLADCDLDLDGVVTQAELEAIAPAQLPELDDRYQLGGAPIDIDDMYDYVIAQLKTQGHFQGEGECDVDGVAHEHDDEHDDDGHDDHDDHGDDDHDDHDDDKDAGVDGHDDHDDGDGGTHDENA